MNRISKLLRRSHLPALGVAAAMLTSPSALRAQDSNGKGRIADLRAHEEQLIKNEAYRNRHLEDFEKRIVTNPDFDLRYRKHITEKAAASTEKAAKSKAGAEADRAQFNSDQEKTKLAKQELAPLLKLSGSAYAKEFRDIAPKLIAKYGHRAHNALLDSIVTAMDSDRITEEMGDKQLNKDLDNFMKGVVIPRETSKARSQEEVVGRVFATAQKNGLQPAK